MRWILVLLILYIIPLIILFKNYNSFRRSCIYGSAYIVLVTTIVISNIYISGLNKIRDVMYYKNHLLESDYQPSKNAVNNEESKLEENKQNESKNENEDEDEVYKPMEEELEHTGEFDLVVDDKELMKGFKAQIYDIEVKALLPMRECMPYTENIAENIKKLSTIRNDVEYASNMCKSVISMYEKMDVPQLSKEEYTKILEEAKNDVKVAYELREKAMNSALSLIDTKNPKYIGHITEYFNLSDKYILSYKEQMEVLKSKLDNK